MISSEARFSPKQPLVHGFAQDRCRAIVVVPARNEADSLPLTLDALASQEDLNGQPLDPASFEILMLLNNCTDASVAVAGAWRAEHPDVQLHVAERSFPAEQAHVGTARRVLMDTAWHRLHRHAGVRGILSTDSDTIVANDWVAQNLQALQRGADAVGGYIELKPGELERLPEGVQRAYLNDRKHQRLLAELEDLLDPQAGDPWPRHLQHFGASMACTPAAYERVGGLPPVHLLEDKAFVDQLYRIGACLRHEPAVRVFTSARFDGRATVGLAWQVRTWQEESDTGEPHLVWCSARIEHRFRSLRYLRHLHQQGKNANLQRMSNPWRERVRDVLAAGLATGEFLARIDCDAWIEETYTGRAREAEITQVNRELRAAIRREQARMCNEVSGSIRVEDAPAVPIGVGADPSGTAQHDAH